VTHLLLIVAAVAVVLSDAAPNPPVDLGAWAVAALVWGAALVPWVIAHSLVVRGVRIMDRRGGMRGALLAERALATARVVACVATAAGALVLGWLGVVRRAIGDWPALDELAALAPLIVALVLGWFSQHAIEQRVNDALVLRRLDEGEPLPRRRGALSFVVAQVRLQMLFILVPVFAMLAWAEGVAWLEAGASGPQPAHLPGWIASPGSVSVWAPVAQLGGVAVILCVMPAVLRRLWDTAPLDPGPLRDTVGRVFRLAGVRVREVLVWRTDGRMANAAIVGLVRPLRYLLLSDALLEHLTDVQLEAVVAHEAAHVRRRHMPWLAVVLLATMIVVSLPVGLVGEATGLDPDSWVWLVMQSAAALIAAAWMFGLVSRRFEWEADAFAVRQLSGHAVEPEAAWAMAGALEQVARLNHVPRSKRSWRHGSIATRTRRIDRLVGTPVDRLPIDRLCRRIRLAGLVALVLGGGAALAFTLPISLV